MHPIGFFGLMSNRSPVICGFRQIKRANPWGRIYPLELWYDLDIPNGFGYVIHHSMGGDWGLGFLSKNDDITSFQGSLKVLICWRNHRFHTS